MNYLEQGLYLKRRDGIFSIISRVVVSRITNIMAPYRGPYKAIGSAGSFMTLLPPL